MAFERRASGLEGRLLELPSETPAIFSLAAKSTLLLLPLLLLVRKEPLVSSHALPAPSVALLVVLPLLSEGREIIGLLGRALTPRSFAELTRRGVLARKLSS
jgi:hypothetical protein